MRTAISIFLLAFVTSIAGNSQPIDTAKKALTDIELGHHYLAKSKK
jgi:hypothetical protein